MNISKMLIPALMLVCILLPACVSATLPPPTAVPLTFTSIPPDSFITPTANVLTQALTVGNYQHVMECSGEGSPVVLLLGGRAAAWKPIQAEINRSTRTCVFDYMGSNTQPLSAKQIAMNVHILLEDASITSLCNGGILYWRIYGASVRKLISR